MKINNLIKIANGLSLEEDFDEKSENKPSEELSTLAALEKELASRLKQLQAGLSDTDYKSVLEAVNISMGIGWKRARK